MRHTFHSVSLTSFIQKLTIFGVLQIQIHLKTRKTHLVFCVLAIVPLKCFLFWGPSTSFLMVSSSCGNPGGRSVLAAIIAPMPAAAPAAPKQAFPQRSRKAWHFRTWIFGFAGFCSFFRSQKHVLFFKQNTRHFLCWKKRYFTNHRNERRLFLFLLTLQLPHRYIPPGLPSFDDQMDVVHLFVDGSCRCPTFPEVALASYAVVSATHDMLIIQGALHGSRQSSDRAELEAIIRCIEVAAGWHRNITIWSDSAYASSGLARLLKDPEDIPGQTGSHELEWLRLRDVVVAFPCTIEVQHVPGHGDVTVYHQDFEDWASYWNHRADRAAAAAFDAHHPEVLQAWRALHAHHDHQMALHAQLQALHWDVASTYQQEQANRLDRDMDEEEADGPSDPLVCLQPRQLEPELYWLDGLPEHWLSCDAFRNLASRFTMQWTRMVVLFLQECRDSPDATCYQLSWPEIAALLVLKFEAALPVASSTAKGQWISSNSSIVAGRGASTAATALRLTRDFFRQLAKEFGLAFPVVQHLNLVNLGVHIPQSGIQLLLSQGDAVAAARALLLFTSRRPIRTVNDLSRPFTLL